MIYIYIYMISGWWFEPLWKISVNWDDYSLYMRNLFQTTNQSHYTSHFMYIPLYIPWIYHWCPMNLRTYVYIYIHIIFENTYSIYIYISITLLRCDPGHHQPRLSTAHFCRFPRRLGSGTRGLGHSTNSGSTCWRWFQQAIEDGYPLDCYIASENWP